LTVAGTEVNIAVVGSLERKLVVARFVENNPVAGSPEWKLAVSDFDNPVAGSGLERRLAVAGFVEDNPAACPGTGHLGTGFE